MRVKTLAVAVMITAFTAAPTLAKPGSHTVRGHVTKHGTYVPPHRATKSWQFSIEQLVHKRKREPLYGEAGYQEPA